MLYKRKLGLREIKQIAQGQLHNTKYQNESPYSDLFRLKTFAHSQILVLFLFI